MHGAGDLVLDVTSAVFRRSNDGGRKRLGNGSSI